MKSEFTAKLGIDNSDFNRGLQNATQQASAAGQKMAQGLGEKFGAKQVLGGFMASLSLSMEGIAKGIASAIMGGSAEGWGKAMEAAKRYDEELKRSIREQMSDEKKLQSLKDELGATKKDANRGQAQLKEGEGSNMALRESGGLLRGAANKLGLGGAETASEAEERQANAKLRVLEIQKEIKALEAKTAGEKTKGIEAEVKLREDILKAIEEADDAEASAARDALTDTQRKMLLDAEALDLRSKASDILEGDAAKYRLIAQAIGKENEARKLGLSIQKDQQEEDEKRIQNVEKLRQAETDLAKAKAEALREESEAERELSRMKLDLIAAQKEASKASKPFLGTLDQIASGERGSSTDQGAEKRARKLEEQARRASDFGTKTGDEKAQQFQSEANKIRSGLENRTSSDTDPAGEAAQKRVEDLQKAVEEFAASKKEEAEAMQSIVEKIEIVVNALK